MVQYCCVPGCKSNAWTPEISFHSFPRDNDLKKLWLIKIRRDERRNKKVSSSMKVCSKHFVESDYREIVNGCRKCLSGKAVPSVFSFTSPRKLKDARRKICYKKTRPTAAVGLDLVTPISDSDGDVPVLTELELSAANGLLMLCDATNTNDEETSQPSEDQDCTGNEVFNDLKSELQQVKRQNVILETVVAQLQKELADTKKTVSELEKQKDIRVNTLTANRDFAMDKIKNSEHLTYYTGFDSVNMYETFRDFVKSSQQVSYSTALAWEDQLLLVLCKLRQGFENVDLAFRFNISQRHVSKIFINFINDLYYRLGCLNIWPHRKVILENAPANFKEKYPTTIVILDGTELKIESPSSLVLQSQSFSTYKSSNTVKALVGCDPKGGIIFISQLYTGSISDKKITEASGLYDVLREKLAKDEVLPGDVVMVDKGFNIKKEVESLGLNLNVPPMASNEQFEENEVYETRKIASCRVHVERAIRRVKTFKILNGIIPITSLPHLNQVWTVCCILCGFRCVTRSDRPTTNDNS